MPPSGVHFEQTPTGFLIRASCLSFTDTVMRVGLAAVVSSLPFVLWWDLIRDVWSSEGMNFWFTLGFLAIWAAAIAYADWIALMSIFGQVRITKDGDRGEVFAGIGAIGRRHRFNWSDFRNIAEVETERTSSKGQTSRTHNIYLTGPSKSYKFGWQVPLDRQLFIVETVRKLVFEV
jgi:hypothetical protein